VCTTIIVGKRRSVTGEVLLAHSEELGRNSAHYVCAVPGRTAGPDDHLDLHSSGTIRRHGRVARHLATRIFEKRHYPGDHTSGINEHGVAVVNNMAMMRGVPEARLYDVIPGGLIWTEFIQMVLEQATSARQGAALVGDLCERHGLSCDSGTMVAIVDPDEAWWVEMARDGIWAAERIADHEVSVRANCFRIGTQPPYGDASVMGRRDLDDVARSKGWQPDREGGFAATFGDPGNQSDRYNLDRHDMLEMRLRDLPLVGVADVMALLRDVYEGTPLQRTRPDGSPFRTEVRTIARMNTEACTVFEPRRHLVPELAHRMWCCLSTSLSGVFVPFHLGVDAIEAHYATAGGRYSPESAYWLFAELAKLVDYRYRASIDTVRQCWDVFEAETRRDLEALEAGLPALEPAAAVARVNAFDGQRAVTAVQRLRDLLDDVKTRCFYEDF
jgi:dipeptidase